MTNKRGITFVKGVWYKSNFMNFFFRYLKDREHGGVIISGRYSGGKLSEDWKNETINYYVNNTDYLDRATEATEEDLRSVGIITTPFTNNSYSIF